MKLLKIKLKIEKKMEIRKNSTLKKLRPLLEKTLVHETIQWFLIYQDHNKI